MGNIIRYVVASGVSEFGWGWSFVVPGFLVIFVGVFVFLFLVERPEDLGFETPRKEVQMKVKSDETMETLNVRPFQNREFRFFWSNLVRGGMEVAGCGTLYILSFLFKAGGLHLLILVSILLNAHSCCR